MLLVGLPVFCVLGVLEAGRGLTAPPAAEAAKAAGIAFKAVSPLDLPRLVLQLGVILLLSRVVGALFRRIGQPQVMGEMIAGLLLGPSVFGALAPGMSAALFPVSSLDYLQAFSQVGLVLFMFVVGLSLNHRDLHGYGQAAVLISHVSIAAPFFLGALAALAIYPRFSSANVPFHGFALFMGAAMSITAFPVLARILAEKNLLRTRLGSMTIACAAVDDVTGWCVLAYIVMLVRVSAASTPAWMTVAGSVVYLAVMLTVVTRIVPRFEQHFRKHGKLSENVSAAILLLLLASALCTELLGIHLLFGAFLAGAIMPKEHDFVEYLKHRYESLTVTLLMPLFFAYTGLRTTFGSVSGIEMWLYTGLALAVAVSGKLGGCLAAGRIAGMPWRDSAALGILMNTRGLMQLIILNVGLDIGVISPSVFTMMVVVALSTTFMTTPLLDAVYRAPKLTASAAAAGRVA
jgi:Kef-type K+ transport system membrane component KefB